MGRLLYNMDMVGDDKNRAKRRWLCYLVWAETAPQFSFLPSNIVRPANQSLAAISQEPGSSSFQSRTLPPSPILEPRRYS